MSRPPLPPFTVESAAQKARMAEDAWNTRDPERVALAYIEGGITQWETRRATLTGLLHKAGPGVRLSEDLAAAARLSSAMRTRSVQMVSSRSGGSGRSPLR